MKKLLLDSCIKTAFSYDNMIYQQSDGVSMGSYLAPVLANIILTEFEKVVVMPLMKNGILKLYCRYVNDLLVLFMVKLTFMSKIPIVGFIYKLQQLWTMAYKNCMD